MTIVPHWVHLLGMLSIGLALLSVIVAAIDEMAGHSQQMWIMNVVWPITMLWAGPLGLFAYYTAGRTSTKRAVAAAKREGRTPPNKAKPFWQSVAVGATHCGSGCTLADLVVEWAVLAVPVTLFGSHVFGGWAADLVVAFVLGIAFQYFTIAPMRDLGVAEGLRAAIKADTLSLAAWQLGMYGWMAVVLFALYSPEALPKTGLDFWFMMQLAMVAGFCTSYPVNWWLLRAGMKETM